MESQIFLRQLPFIVFSSSPTGTYLISPHRSVTCLLFHCCLFQIFCKTVSLCWEASDGDPSVRCAIEPICPYTWGFRASYMSGAHYAGSGDGHIHLREWGWCGPWVRDFGLRLMGFPYVWSAACMHIQAQEALLYWNRATVSEGVCERARSQSVFQSHLVWILLAAHCVLCVSFFSSVSPVLVCEMHVRLSDCTHSHNTGGEKISCEFKSL